MGTIESREWVEVTDAAKLRELVGEVKPRAATKERPRLHLRDRQWLAASPYCVIATADAEGNCDASPRATRPGSSAPGRCHDRDPRAQGQPPGRRLSQRPVQPARRAALDRPGPEETLRINGRARIVSEAPFFDDMVVKGHRPVLALVIEIDTIYFHCGKASMRSGLWKPETWNPDVLPSHACMVKETQTVSQTIEELTEYYGAQYEKQLY
ncbi:pyridoxamine 5'-phosphate oxidase family protein [Glycomyces albus]